MKKHLIIVVIVSLLTAGCRQPSVGGTSTFVDPSLSVSYGYSPDRIIFLIIDNATTAIHTAGVRNGLLFSSWTGQALSDGNRLFEYQADATVMEISGYKFPLNRGRIFLVDLSGKFPRIEQLDVELKRIDVSRDQLTTLAKERFNKEVRRILKLAPVKNYFGIS